MDYKELTYLGLSEKEAKVYLASLELGSSTVQKISQKAKVNRATTYVVIEALINKGMMSQYTEGKKQYFVAESPEKLSLLFREQAMEIQRKHEYLDKILPQLRGLNSDKKDGPVVRYFEGKEGMRAIAEEIFVNDNKGKIRMIYSYDLLVDMFGEDEIKEMRKKRQSKQIKAEIITNDEQNRLETDASVYRVSTDKNKITSDVAIFGDRVRIISQKGKQSGLVIENKEIANTLKTLFDLAVKGLQKKEG
ncbi:hypothetical protein C0583_05435 [Candidatus Parcubacteria bacterium]|nr:MAG: hypothetical protein C0583_05435 [Candidatus Parcubacteria bacterium]